jgi:hypothetical protein
MDPPARAFTLRLAVLDLKFFVFCLVIAVTSKPSGICLFNFFTLGDFDDP